MEDRHRFDLKRLVAVLAAFCMAGGLCVVAGAEPMRGIDVATGNASEIPLDAPATHVMFLAGWCPPCLAQVDELREWEARHGADGYRLVLVAVGRRQTVERVRKLANDRDLPGIVLFDSEGGLEERWSVQAVPHHLVVDAEGNAVWSSDEPNASLEAAIERLLEASSGGGR